MLGRTTRRSLSRTASAPSPTPASQARSCSWSADLTRRKPRASVPQGLIDRIRAGEVCEVSVGAFVTTAPESGTHDGKPYSAIWKSITPDHLAFVSRGACDAEMGCGTRAASAGKNPYDPPDGYAPGLTKMRDELAPRKPAVPKPVCPFDDKSYTGQPDSAAPNGYQIALDRQKEQGR